MDLALFVGITNSILETVLWREELEFKGHVWDMPAAPAVHLLAAAAVCEWTGTCGAECSTKAAEPSAHDSNPLLEMVSGPAPQNSEY